MPNPSTHRITNISGVARYFSFLPPHGATLTTSGTGSYIDIEGDPAALLAGNKRERDGYLATLAAGAIRVDRFSGLAALAATLPASATISLIEGGDTAVKRLKFTLTATPITLVDATTNGSFGGIKLCDLAAGGISLINAYANLAVTTTGGVGATATFKYAVGTVLVSTSDTLSSTLANIVPSTSITLAANAGNAAVSNVTAAGIASAPSLFLNCGVPDAGSTANGAASVTGTISVVLSTAGIG